MLSEPVASKLKQGPVYFCAYSRSVQKATYLVMKLCGTEAVEHRGT